jgi:hypothetical protein
VDDLGVVPRPSTPVYRAGLSALRYRCADN